MAPFDAHVTLEKIKTDGRLDEMALVRNSRLSVQPVTESEWEIVCALGNVTP
ncbi:MAG: EVE domain-containing protein [Roseibium sp.]